MEILKLTTKIKLVADKIQDEQNLTPGERNLAKNILNEYAERTIQKSIKSSKVEKSPDANKIKHREKVLRYRVKKRLDELMENLD